MGDYARLREARNGYVAAFRKWLMLGKGAPKPIILMCVVIPVIVVLNVVFLLFRM